MTVTFHSVDFQELVDKLQAYILPRSKENDSACVADALVKSVA